MVAPVYRSTVIECQPEEPDQVTETDIEPGEVDGTIAYHSAALQLLAAEKLFTETKVSPPPVGVAGVGFALSSPTASTTMTSRPAGVKDVVVRVVVPDVELLTL
jgi:hypothetical protein